MSASGTVYYSLSYVLSHPGDLVRILQNTVFHRSEMYLYQAPGAQPVSAQEMKEVMNAAFCANLFIMGYIIMQTAV